MALGLLLAGCDGCGANAGLGASGARGYVRCLEAGASAERVAQVGGVTLRIAGRDLHVEGAKLPLRIAAFAGAGFMDPPGVGGALDTLAGSGARLILVLGGMGDTPDRARQAAARLAALRLPVVFVSGGRDGRERTGPALSGHEGIVDATTLDRIRIGADTFLPVAGSSGGRYALDDASCGYGLADLKARVGRLGPAGASERRWLLSWEAPAGPLTRAPAEVGDPDLAEFAVRTGAAGGIHGWPELHVGEPFAGGSAAPAGVAARDLAVVVPRAWGPWQERSDGERVPPGYALLELSEAGLSQLASVKP